MEYNFRLALIISFIFLSWTCCVKRLEFNAVEENGKWGYIDRNGNWIIRPQFVLAQDFLNTGIAAVIDDSGWVYIDKKGNHVIRPFIFDNGPDYFSEGLARFTVNERFGYFDQYGKIVIPPLFNYARPFCGGLAAVCEGGEIKHEGEHSTWFGGRWGFINKKGEIIVPFIYDQVEDFRDGQTRVRSGHEWKIINTKGNG